MSSKVLQLLVGVMVVTAPFSSNSAQFGLLDSDIFENRASITSQTEYNTNPRMTPADKQGVFQETLTPRYKFSDISENQELYFDFRLVVVRSSKKDIVIDRENPNAILGYSRQWERDNFTISTAYNETSSRTTEIAESGVVGADLTNITRNYNLNWRHDLNDRLSVATGAIFNKTEFQGGSASSALVSNRNRTLTASLNYLWSETLTPVIQLSHTKQYSGSADPTSVFNYSTGLDWQYSDYWKFGFRFGKNKIHLGSNPQTPSLLNSSASSSSNGWSGSINTSYSYNDLISFNADVSRQVSSSNLGGLNESDRASISMVYQMDALSNLNLNYNINKNRTVNQTESTQYNINYSRSLSDTLTMSVYASYRELDNEASNADAKVIGFNLSYDHPVF